MARGEHNGHPGWPVGIGNPLFTEKRLGTLLLCDQAMATSGSNIQFFRHEGKRYGHILDPRTGWPVDGMLSVTVLAPSAALADALSTAFFVMGVEKARQCCKNWPEVGVILLPFPDKGNKVQPTVVNIPEELIVWDEGQITRPCRPGVGMHFLTEIGDFLLWLIFADIRSPLSCCSLYCKLALDGNCSTRACGKSIRSAHSRRGHLTAT